MTPDDVPDLSWMPWVTAGIAVVFVVIALVITVVVLRFVRSSMRSTVNPLVNSAMSSMAGTAFPGQQPSGLRSTGRMALADILSLTQTGTMVNYHPMMVIGLHVHGAGMTPFDVEHRTAVPVSRQPLLHHRRVAVVADPGSHEVDIDWQATAAIVGSVPMRISSQTGETYDLTGQAEPILEIFEILRRNGISTQGAIDLRSEPRVRDEVAAVARRFAQQQ
ncbi:hypothetical protein ACWDTI_19910 [Gordonia sp. NPDC003424]